MFSSFRAVWPLVFCIAIGTSSVGRAEDLPEAPTPQQHEAVPATRPSDRASVERRRWSGVVEPGEKVPTLTVRNKLLFAAHEELRWYSLIPIAYSAGYGTLTNGDPKLGTNADDYGKRVGYAAARQGIQRELSDSLFPILFHEDPRYYRMAYGSYTERSWHAARRIFITQTDSGKKTFNFSDVLGRGSEAATTQLYYPERSQTPEVVFSAWGLSLLGLGAGNLADEFWPDIRHKLFHHD